MMTVTPGSQKALFYKDNKLYVTAIPEGAANLSTPVNMDNMSITIDYPKEWAQIFDEAWRAYRDGFYLENMHGVDLVLPVRSKLVPDLSKIYLIYASTSSSFDRLHFKHIYRGEELIFESNPVPTLGQPFIILIG